MELSILFGLAFAAGGASVLKRRLDLSRAKHPSLSGHSRIASRLAKLVPFYEYDQAEVFGVDGAPADIADRRRKGFMELASRLKGGREVSLSLSDVAREGLADLRFTSAYRVPFQFRKLVSQHLRTGSFATTSSGVTLTDPDGNVAYDLTGSYGVNVFGYDFYKDCMAEGAAQAHTLGPVLGHLHPVVVENVRRLKEISGHDEVSFHMSGTEAVMQAVRLARYHTGRSHVVRFCGAYHGWWDDVQPGVGNPTTADRTYTLKECDDATLRVLRTRRDIACVLVNPLQSLHPNVAAPGDSSLLAGRRVAPVGRVAYAHWLQQVRDVCAQRGIVFILDEVFLGFRLARGGAQEYFGVKADLVTYGKTVAGGFPIGVVCGRHELMKRFRENHPADICFARGTFNSHPYVMASMSAFLKRLELPAVAGLYATLDETWTRRAEQVNTRMAALGIPIQVAHLSTVWTVLYTQPSRYNWLFQYYLRAAGLALSWVGTGRLVFSLNFTEADFAVVLERFEAAARRMRDDGWWMTPAGLTDRTIHRQVLRELARAFIATGLSRFRVWGGRDVAPQTQT